MVRGSDDDSKSSGSKPEYDGTIKRWSSAWNAIKNFMHVNGKLQHGEAKESINGAALEERLSPTDGAEQAELLLRKGADFLVPPTIPRVGNLCGGRVLLGEPGVLSFGTGVLASWPLALSNQRGWVTRGRYPVLGFSLAYLQN